MRIELSEAEMCRAIERYIRGKNVSDSPNHDYVVSLHWQGKQPYALVDIKPAIPVLTEVIEIRDIGSEFDRDLGVRPIEGHTS